MSLPSFTALRSALVVEPYDDLASLLVLVLERRGVEVTRVVDGQSAIDLFAGRPFDLLVSELRLDTVDGAAVLDAWRAAGSHAPVIFVTDHVELAPREQLAADDCCAWVMRKPVDLATFDEALAAADRREHHDDCVHRRADPVSSS